MQMPGDFTALPVELEQPVNDLAVDAGRTINKVMWRLIPFAVAIYIFNYLDRLNVWFTKTSRPMGAQIPRRVSHPSAAAGNAMD